MSVAPDAPPAPAAPTLFQRWAVPVALAVIGGLLVGLGIVTWRNAPDRARSSTRVETRVAGISEERDPATVPATDAPTTDAPTTDAPTTVAPTTAAPTTTASRATSAPEAPVEAAAAAVDDSTAVADDDLADLRTRVLAQIRFPWQEVLPGWRIEFLPERRGYRGSTFPGEEVIRIYRRAGSTLADYVHVTAHELGHAVDVTHLDDEDHARWNEARGRDAGARWWVASGADDFSSGAGDWAECFAWWQLPSGRFYSELGPAPSARQLAVLADIVATSV